MFRLAVIYDESNKRYVIPFEVVEKHVNAETLKRIKADVKKELRKL